MTTRNLGGNLLTRLPVLVTLTVVWVLLWGHVTPLVVVGGLLVALLVTTAFPFPPAKTNGRLRPWHAERLLAIFLADLLIASLQFAWIAIRPAAPPRSAVIDVEMVTRSELLLTITSELISLVPGSLLIEIDSEQGHIWLHILDGSTPEKIKRARASAIAQEARVIAALGSDAELAACRARSTA